MKIASRLLAFLFLCPVLAVQAQSFKHPGVLVDRVRLDFVKKQVNAGVEPFAAAFKAMQASKPGAKDYQPEGPPADHFVLCGSYSNPNHGCSEEGRDSTAAYTQALLWYLTGERAYAENAIRIMNLWARNLTEGHKASNAPLQSAWTAEKWPAAAEIIRYTYDGWKAEDIALFRKMLLEQYLPFFSGRQGEVKNGNWQLSMIDAMFGIAVFAEDRALFEQAATLWRKWVPAYAFHYETDGGKPVTFPGSPRDWNGQVVFNAATNGVAQETCRDTGHTGLGIAAMFNAAETAYIQGTDLLTPQRARLTAMLEYHAGLLQGVRTNTVKNVQPVPENYPGLCTNTGTYIPMLQPTMERAYNAMHNRMGVPLPQTERYLRESMRPFAPGTDFHTHVWETLTHGGEPPAAK